MNYYEVTAKFGHVGRNFYIIKKLAIKANNGKEAAFIGRWTKRVKHHIKDAIIDVRKISKDDALNIWETNNNDPYFLVSNKQEQRKYCKDIINDIMPMVIQNHVYKKSHKERKDFCEKIQKITLKEAREMIQESYLA